MGAGGPAWSPTKRTQILPILIKIAETSKDSIGKLKSLVDELKTVEEHEKGILGE